MLRNENASPVPSSPGGVDETMSEKLKSSEISDSSDDSSESSPALKLDIEARTRQISKKYKDKLVISMV